MRSFCVIIVASFSACPMSSGPDAGFDSGVQPAHCDVYASTWCDRLIACGIAEADARDDCLTLASRECGRVLAPSLAGFARIDPAATEQCRAALSAAACEFVERDAYRECLYAPQTRLPAQELGERCFEHDHCLSNACGGTSACGTCSTPAAIDQDCATGVCDSREAFCNRSQRCEALHADGAPCLNRADCASGLCNLNGRCGPTARGEACDSEKDCQATDFCLGLMPFFPRSPGRCQPRVAAGAVCQHQDFDSAGGCELGTWCLDGRCVDPRASLTDGAECANDRQCTVGAFCEITSAEPFVTGRCVRPSIGGPCVSEQERCPAGARCIAGAAGRSCHALGGRGTSCSVEDSRWDDCRVGLSCRLGVCSSLLPDDRPCASNSQCRSSRCARGRCTAPAVTGEDCQSPLECSSGICAFIGGAATGQCQALACF